jgi:acetyl esterase/lipase
LTFVLVAFMIVLLCDRRVAGGAIGRGPGAIRSLGNGIALVFAAFLLFATIWTIVPAPTLPLLAFAVLVPELAPWFAIACAIALAIVTALARGRARLVAVVALLIAFACTLVPLVQYPSTRAAADAELAAQLGDDTTQPAIAHAFDVRVMNDRTIATRDGARLSLDVYRPDIAGVRPTIVTVYGGAWVFGSRKQLAPLDESYAKLGYTVVGIEYRHAPAYRFPTQLHDVQDALAAIATHASAWGVDRTRVALLGKSAGAELALLAAYAPEPVHVRAAIGYYSPTDLTSGYDDPPFPDPSNVRKILVTYLDATPAERPELYRAGSPIDRVRPGLPPTFLICGRRDSLVRIEFQRAMRDALRAHGNRVVAIELPWSNHVFDEVPTGLGASIATPAVRRFLAATL